MTRDDFFEHVCDVVEYLSQDDVSAAGLAKWQRELLWSAENALDLESRRIEQKLAIADDEIPF